MSRCLALILGLAPFVAFAQNQDAYRCSHGGLVRRVEIVRDTNADVPCSVNYTKETEAPGATEVLWTAEHEAGYCEARTREFIAKLESWGWQCEAMPADSAARD